MVKRTKKIGPRVGAKVKKQAKGRGGKTNLTKRGREKAGPQKIQAALAQSCGSVRKPVAISRKEIKQLVLQVAAQPTGSAFPPNMPDDTPISGGLRVGSGDQIWPLAQLCMNFGRFAPGVDDLWVNRLYIVPNGKTLGTFVNCLQCCYQQPHPA